MDPIFSTTETVIKDQLLSQAKPPPEQQTTEYQQHCIIYQHPDIASTTQRGIRLLSLGVIRKVDELTEWCYPAAIVQKKNETICLCIDLTKLNSGVQQ